ncbi:MAG: M20/M25/M40 family metallo-hydrolase [Verrucomicrobia bacterium]|nr:M20/M25/M40 family metallo-hydrolase [Verrucomicrobiota bacterium]
MNRRADIYTHIDQHWDEHLQRVKEFVRVPSISATGEGIAQTAENVAAFIREAGGKAEIVPTKGWPVVYGELNVGAPKTLLIYNMYDVQPVVGEEWLIDPFGGEVIMLPNIGECLVSRGVYNTKGPLAQFFNALKTIKTITGTYPCNFKFVIEGEEELSSKHLPDFVRANRARLDADAAYFAIYSQQLDGRATLAAGCKGIVFLELSVSGGEWGGPTQHTVHSSHAVWFASPTWRLVHALATMLSHDQQRILIDGLYDDISPPSAADESAFIQNAGIFEENVVLKENAVLKFKCSELHGVDLLRKYFHEPSLNINGIISGHVTAGTKTVLPHKARARIDIRLVPNMRPERVIALVRAHLDKRGFKEVQITVYDAYSWSRTSVEDPVAQAMIRALRSFNVPLEIWPNMAASAPFYLFTDELKMPLVMGGLGHGGCAHAPNEYATIEGMQLFEKPVAAFLFEFAGDSA